MKKAVLLFLLPLLMVPHFMGVFLQAYYFSHRTYYSRVLCENRQKPSLHCNGHCYLSKQMKKAEEGESRSAGFFKELNEFLFVSYQQPVTTPVIALESKRMLFLPYQFRLPNGSCNDFFIPPRS